MSFTVHQYHRVFYSVRDVRTKQGVQVGAHM